MTDIDGLEILQSAFTSRNFDILPVILETARWTSPDLFESMPVWFPEYWRHAPLYKESWSERKLNKGKLKHEENNQAAAALKIALGHSNWVNWTCCHLWGSDGFKEQNQIVTDSRYYSCLANMIYLPTPLKAFTDASPQIKFALRVVAFHLYGWICDHPQVNNEASLILSGNVPLNYPDHYPHPNKRILPSEKYIAPFDERLQVKVRLRKEKLRQDLSDLSLIYFPRETVQSTLKHWNVDLTSR